MRWIIIAMAAVVASSSLPGVADARAILPISDKTLQKRCSAVGGDMIGSSSCVLPGGATVTCGGKGKTRACDTTADLVHLKGKFGQLGTTTGPTNPVPPKRFPGSSTVSAIGTGPVAGGTVGTGNPCASTGGCFKLKLH